MAPLSVADNGPSTAFHHQFSDIIRIESRLHRDNSEDMTGPAHTRWVTQHLWDIAQAQGFTDIAQVQGFTLPPPTEPSNLNVHAQEFVASPTSQAATDSRSDQTLVEHTRTWYDNFYLADRDGPDSSNNQLPATQTAASHNPPNRYSPFDPLELSEYRAAVQAHLLSQNDKLSNAYSGPTDQFPDPYLHSHQSPPYPEIPTTPPTNVPHVRYPSTPPNRSTRQNNHHHRRQTSSLDNLSNLTTITALCLSTESSIQSRTDSPSAAPDHYKALTIYAIEIHVGDYIQSIDNPGKVKSHSPVSTLDPETLTTTNDARPVSTNGGLRIQIEGADGVLHTQIFKGLEKVQILRYVGSKDAVAVDGAEKVKKEEEAGKGEEDVTVKEDAVGKEDAVTKEKTVTE